MAKYRMKMPFERENDSFYTDKPSFTIKYLRMEIDRQFGIAGFFPPLALISYLFGFLDIVVLAYSVYHVLGFIVVAYLFCRKATVFDQKNKDIIPKDM